MNKLKIEIKIGKRDFIFECGICQEKYNDTFYLKDEHKYKNSTIIICRYCSVPYLSFCNPKKWNYKSAYTNWPNYNFEAKNGIITKIEKLDPLNLWMKERAKI